MPVMGLRGWGRRIIGWQRSLPAQAAGLITIVHSGFATRDSRTVQYRPHRCTVVLATLVAVFVARGV